MPAQTWRGDVLAFVDADTIVPPQLQTYLRVWHWIGIRLGIDVQVVPSPRRFDRTPIWRTLIWTRHAFIAPFRKTKSAWTQWYISPPR
jgi:hypothetical protein